MTDSLIIDCATGEPLIVSAAPIIREAPAIVTMRQARLALFSAGLLGSVDAAIQALPSPDREAAEIEWEYATEVARDSALVSGLLPALGLSTGQVDDLFRLAASI